MKKKLKISDAHSRIKWDEIGSLLKKKGIQTLLALLLFVPTSFGQLWNEVAKSIGADADYTDNFGCDIAISGDYAIIGANNDDQFGTNSGSAYIFERDVDGTWNQVQKVAQSSPGSWDWFGEAVAIEGDYAVVGAHGDDVFDNEGAATVFKREDDGTWLEVVKLTASDPATNDRFGQEVSIYGDYITVGAINTDDVVLTSGSAYVFKLQDDGSWIETQILHASDPGGVDQFGLNIAMNGEFMVIGARNDDDGEDSGSSYIFELGDDDMWTEVQKITASDAEAGDSFGHSAAMNGDFMVIGAYREDDAGSQAGAAYIFQIDDSGTWIEIQKISASDAAAIDLFGENVAISESYIVIGSTSDEGAADTGSAYIFEQDDDGLWLENQKIIASDGDAYDIFSKGVAISGNQIMIGAYYDDDADINSGAIYIFQRCDDLVLDLVSAELCLGEEVTLFATSESGESIIWSDAVVNGESFSPPLGETTYTAISGESDCEFQVTLTVLESPEVNITSTDSIICDGVEITLNGEGAISYEWSEEVFDGESFTPPLGETTYTVVGTNDLGCQDSAIIAVIVNALPEVTATADAITVCNGDEITLIGEGATTYNWDGGATDGEAFTPALGETTYTVIGTDDNDCENTATIDITVNALPEVIASADNTSVCDREEITLTGAGATIYLWDGGVIDGMAFEPMVGETTFTVTGTDDNDCAASDEITITVLENPIVEIETLDDELLCIDQASVVLAGSPATGVFSGVGVTGSTFDPNTAGEGTHIVYYTFENDAGCSATDSTTVKVVDCLSVASENKMTFQVYPNPFSDFAVIKFNQPLTDGYQIIVYDLLGEEVFREINLTGTEYVLTKENLGTGVYFLSLMDQNKQLFVTKLIVQ